MSAANQIQRAVNGTAKQSDHPTIMRVMAQAEKFAEAMPKVMTKDRFMRIAIGAIRRNPKLLECDPLSLMGSLLVAAQLGFEVNTPLGHFYLIPRYNSKTQRMEADGQIGYKGWLDLLDRTGMVASMTAEVVHEKDHFVYKLGDEPGIEHLPSLGDRGKPIAYYVSVRLTNGGVFRKVLSRQDVEKYRARSKTPNAGPWVSDFDAMALKTVFLRLVTWMPKSLEVRHAVAYENTIEANGSVRYRENQGLVEYQIPEPVEQSPPAEAVAYDDEPIDIEPDPDPEPQPKPAPVKPAAKTAPRVKQKPKASEMEVISETVGDPIEAPFDSEPAKPAERKTSSVAKVVMDIEKWADAAALDHDRNGFPDLGDRQFLMGRIYQNFVDQGFVNPAAKGWFAWLNEIAKFAGDSEAAFQVLEKANKVVLAEYAGVPDDLPEAEEMGPPAKQADKPADPDVETHGQRVAAIEDWMTKAVAKFAEYGVAGFEKPADVLNVMYEHAASDGVVKGSSKGWRPRVTELADCKISLHKLTQIFAAHARSIIEDQARGDMGDREPGSEG